MNICRICRREVARLTFEHVPPRSAFNNERTRVYEIAEWIRRDEESGELPGGRVAQRGAGDQTLCEESNSNTGSWYGNELARAARAAVTVLRQLPLDDIDASVEPIWADVKFQQTAIGPHPLRLIKQIVAMLLATSTPELSLAEPDLGDFVLDRGRTRLPERFQFYLALFAGPLARSTGIVRVEDVARNRADTLVEVAFKPYAYIMTIDSADDVAVPTSNITSCVDVRYNQRADMELSLLVGFGHTPYPADYRTKAMIERDVERNRAPGDLDSST